MTPKARILVVDDNPTLRSLLVETLDAVGYTVSAAGDGVEALEELRKREPDDFDLLLTDVKMPNMDGFSLLRKIRRLYPDLPVLFITGVISEEAMAAASPDGFLAKPFRIARLEELIENTLKAKYSAKTPPAPRRVLINVRRTDFRQSLAEAMSFSNYLPFEVTTPDEALQELERGRFDALITDDDKTETTPGFVDRLREQHPRLPLLLAVEDTKTERVHAKGEDEVVVHNPFSAGDLIAALDRTVNNS